MKIDTLEVPIKIKISWVDLLKLRLLRCMPKKYTIQDLIDKDRE